MRLFSLEFIGAAIRVEIDGSLKEFLCFFLGALLYCVWPQRGSYPHLILKNLFYVSATNPGLFHLLVNEINNYVIV